MTPDVTDEHLVMAAQDGSKEAFLTLYNRYLKRVYNRVKSRIPHEDAEDVTQDIFIAVVRALQNFEHRSSFSTWLFTIVNRQIADYYRHRYRQGKNKTISIEGTEGLEIQAENKNLDEMVVIQQALHKIPENYQEVILMRFADGLTFSEIATQKGQSLEAVKSLYRRAVQAILKEVGKA